MKINLIVFAIFILCLTQGKAQTKPEAGPMKFSLAEAKEYALLNSPVLLNSARDVEIAKKKIWETTASGLPQANLTSAYSYQPDLAGLTELFTSPGDTAGSGGGSEPPQSPFGDLQINPNDLKTSFNMDIQVSQLIFSGQYIVGLQASKAYANLSRIAYSKSRADLIENVSNVYAQVLLYKAIKTTLDSTLKVVEKTYNETQQMYNNGLVESTDVDQLRIQVLNIRSNLSSNARSADFTERLLKFQMGLPINQPVQLTESIESITNVMQLETSVVDSMTISENLDYQMAQANEKMAQLNLKLQKSKFLPTISGYYNRHEDFDDNFFNDQSPNILGLSLSMPLFSSGQRISQVGQAKLDYLKAKTNKEMAEESLLIQYQTTVSGYLSARDIYNMQKENRNLSYKIYMRSITKFREGAGSSLEMNETQSQYFSAESQYYNAFISLVVAKTNLESMLSKMDQ